MTDKRYRPLAVGEVIEEGDQFYTVLGWAYTSQAGKVHDDPDMEYRRPDLCESQNADGEPQADLCGGDDTQGTKAVIRNAGQAKPRKVEEPEDTVEMLRRINEASGNPWKDKEVCGCCRMPKQIGSPCECVDEQMDELNRLLAENEELRRKFDKLQILVDSFRSARHPDVMTDDPPEYYYRD